MFKRKQQDYIKITKQNNIIEKLTAENKVLYLIIGKLVNERKAKEDCIGCKYCKKIYDIVKYDYYYPYDPIPATDTNWIDFGFVCTKQAKCNGKKKEDVQK